jgi:hypothetical protein
LDADADGYPDDDDCDDQNPDVHPDAVESCDGVDEDCDGMIDDAPVDGATWYLDGDADDYGDDDVSVIACEQLDHSYIEISGDCDDEDPTVFPGAEEVCDDGRDNDCVLGGSDKCRTTGTIDGTVAFQWIENDTMADSAGFFPDLAAAGDVNGDGLPDLLVGLEDYNIVDATEDYGPGAAILCSGPLTEVDTLSACIVIASDHQGSGAGYAGRSVTGVGDLDEDGYDDLFVGDPILQDVDFDATSRSCAYSYVFYGPVTSATLIDDADIKFAECYNNFFAVDAAPGPVVGSRRTIVVGSPLFSLTITPDPAGAAYMVDPIAGGEADPTFGFGAVTRLEGELEGDAVGEVVRDLGDIDGDGVDDFGVGSQQRGEPDYGVTYVVTGAPTGVVSLADSRAIFDYGHGFGPAHDENGDGLDDILVTSIADQTVRLFLSPFPDAIDVTKSGMEQASFAIPLNLDLDADDPVGVDVDGDHLADVAFLNRRFWDSGDEAMYVQYGPTEGAISIRDMDLIVTLPTAWWDVSALENVGDVDLDGHEDVIASGWNWDLFLLLGEGV